MVAYIEAQVKKKLGGCKLLIGDIQRHQRVSKSNSRI